jgi:hypothetical protein
MITQFDTQIPTKNFAGTRAKAKNKEAQASALFRSPMYFEDAGSPHRRAQKIPILRSHQHRPLLHIHKHFEKRISWLTNKSTLNG